MRKWVVPSPSNNYTHTFFMNFNTYFYMHNVEDSGTTLQILCFDCFLVFHCAFYVELTIFRFINLIVICQSDPFSFHILLINDSKALLIHFLSLFMDCRDCLLPLRSLYLLLTLDCLTQYIFCLFFIFEFDKRRY